MRRAQLAEEVVVYRGKLAESHAGHRGDARGWRHRLAAGEVEIRNQRVVRVVATSPDDDPLGRLRGRREIHTTRDEIQRALGKLGERVGRLLGEGKGAGEKHTDQSTLRACHPTEGAVDLFRSGDFET